MGYNQNNIIDGGCPFKITYVHFNCWRVILPNQNAQEIGAEIEKTADASVVCSKTQWKSCNK